MVSALEAVARPRAFPFLLQLASAVQGTEQVPSKCCSGKDTSFWHHSSSLSFRPGEFYGISDSPTAPTCTCPPHAISEDEGEHRCHGGPCVSQSDLLGRVYTEAKFECHKRKKRLSELPHLERQQYPFD